jgi:tetratricopeptide (TPR) repeat protein
MRGEHDPERSSDPIGELLRSELSGRRREPRPWMRRPFRPSAARIASLAILVASLVVGGTLLADLVSGVSRPTATPARVARPSEAPPAAEVGWTARVSHVSGGVRTSRGGVTSAPGEGGELRAGDVIEVGEGGELGASFEDGTTLAAAGRATLELTAARRALVRVDVREGSVAIAARSPVEVVSARVRVSADDAAFCVRADARAGLVSVLRGEVEARRVADGRETVLPSGRRLDVEGWTTSRLERAGEALALVSRLSGEPAPAAPPADDGEPEPPATQTQAQAPSPPLVVLVREALEADDVEEAIRLLGTVPAGQGGPALAMLAGEAYRRAERWEEAAQAYEAAAREGEGKQAQMALLRAAELRLRKLGDPARASTDIERFLERFPDGELLDEALLLGGVVFTRAGDAERAISLLDHHLARFPGSPQTTRVHLMLAKLHAGPGADCAAAIVHADAVLSSASTGTLAEQARAVGDACSAGAQP